MYQTCCSAELVPDVTMIRYLSHSSAPTDKWTLEPARDASRAGVVCMDHFDMTGDGVRDLIVGRDDGTVQIYTYDDGEDNAPSLRYTYVSGETDYVCRIM